MDGYLGLSDWDGVNWDDCQKVEQTRIHPMRNELLGEVLILLEGSSPQGVLVLKFSECSSNAVECKSHLSHCVPFTAVKWLHLILWSSQILL